jgi:hypothetical protein
MRCRTSSTRPNPSVRAASGDGRRRTRSEYRLVSRTDGNTIRGCLLRQQARGLRGLRDVCTASWTR